MDDGLDISKLSDDELRRLLITVDYKGVAVKTEALRELESRAWQRGIQQAQEAQNG